MKRTVVFDLDGVLVDLHGALEERVKPKYPNYSTDRILTYDFNKTLDFSKAPQWFHDTMEYCRIGETQYGLNANRDYIFELFSDLSLYKDAKLFKSVEEMLPLVAKKYNIVFHSLAFSREIAYYKSEMLNNYFGDKFNYITSIPIGKDKPCYLGADFIVEDNLHDLKGYIGSGSTLLLVNRPYNLELFNPDLSYVFKNSQRFENIKAIFDYLLKEAEN